MTRVALSAAHLRVRYGSALAAALDSLAVEAGEAVGLIGRNGSGKSTLLRTLGLVEKPTEGTVSFDGRIAPESGALRAALRRGVTLALPAPWLFHGSVLQNVERGLAARRIARAERRRAARDVLAELGIETLEGRDARSLSSGETARVSLARSLVLGTPVVLLDEPFAHLDPAAVPAACSAIRRRLDRGVAVVCAAVASSELDGLQHRVVRIERPA